ncbi:TPA: small membrane protein [Klebsiella variicola subsp. variicola]|nr:small membrane protein [Klebsiella variicola subsp. variicola]
MANLLILALAVVLFVVAVLSFVSYIKERRRLKNTFKQRY